MECGPFTPFAFISADENKLITYTCSVRDWMNVCARVCSCVCARQVGDSGETVNDRVT